MITVRGRFESQIGNYILWGGPFVEGDPCNTLWVYIYTDPEGNYYYEYNGSYIPCDGVFYSGGFYDWGTDQYIWESYYIAGPKFMSMGSVGSPCGGF